MENNSSFLRKIVVVLLILLFFVLQCSVFNSLAMGGIIPNLMIILTSSFGFMRGEKEGLLKDLEVPADLKLTKLSHHKSVLVEVRDYSIRYRDAGRPFFVGVGFSI